MKIGIVGAGIAGLACAARLKESGIDSVLFDKGRRPGGRLSSLSLDVGDWDFGAQYFKPFSNDFAAQVARWQDARLVAPWPDGPDGALVGVPTMGALVAALCQDHDVRFSAQVQRIESDGLGWYLSGPGLCDGPFAGMVIAVPAEQAAPLVSLHDLDMAREAAAAKSRPCWTVMAGFAEPLPGLPHYIRDSGAIAWASRDNSKPGRGPHECWVIQASAEWSQTHLEQDREIVAPQLLAAFAESIGAILPEPTFLKAHRWRFGLSYGQRGRTLWNPRLRLGTCGDWITAPMIEGAWRSGVDMAGQVIETLAPAATRAAG